MFWKCLGGDLSGVLVRFLASNSLGRPYKVLCSASHHRRAVVEPVANFRQTANFRQISKSKFSDFVSDFLQAKLFHRFAVKSRQNKRVVATGVAWNTIDQRFMMFTWLTRSL